MRLLLCCCLLLLSACHTAATLPPIPDWQSSQGHEHADLGRIIDLRSGASLTPAQLVEQLAAAELVLVGEQHDNPDHHRLQLWLLKALAAQRPQGSLLLEMLNPDQQDRVVAAHAATLDGQAPADLPAALAWQKNWDWALYGPIVSYALAQPYPLQAANLNRSEIMQIYAARPALQGRLSTTAPVRETLLADIRESHCGLLPEAQMPAMLAVQQQRDRRMAERLRAAPTPALLLAGGFHARRDLGVPLHLADQGVDAGTLVLQLAEVGKPVSAASADFVWYSAALPEKDHCASLRRPTSAQ
ncbi:MAG: ChaN family lipoprotein [Pseudomonadaceae bacterium]|nr:ChaN family lipoprotein [Pseudomonadaceae bacterium]